MFSSPPNTSVNFVFFLLFLCYVLICVVKNRCFFVHISDRRSFGLRRINFHGQVRDNFLLAPLYAVFVLDVVHLVANVIDLKYSIDGYHFV